MDRIELHDVEYGACAALVGRDQSVLMIDCGSVSRFTREDDAGRNERFAAIFARYQRAARREFLLTHYHSDHMNGFLQQIRREPRYFDRVWLPAFPVSAEKASPLLLVAVYAHFFMPSQGYFSRVNTACLTIYGNLCKTVGAGRVRVLSAGDAFIFDGVTYRVLSPSGDFPVPALLSEAAETLSRLLRELPGGASFCDAAGVFAREYANVQAAFSAGSGLSEAARVRRVEVLSALWARLEQAAPTVDDFSLDPVREALEKVRGFYTELQNDLSLVFHSERPRGDSDADILVTGDASAAVLERIAPELFPGYYAVFAPHHGTESHFSEVIAGLHTAHLLISNGEYHAGGEIAEQYRKMDCVRHCTNCGACPAARETGCCNRLAKCFEQRDAGALALRCTAARGGKRTPCKLYVFGHKGVKGCLCDLPG